MTEPRKSSFRLLACFVIAGWLVGLLEGLMIVRATPRTVVAAYSALLASVPAAILGVLAVVIAAIANRRRKPERLTVWLQRVSTRAREADRRPVVALHALVLSGIVLAIFATAAATIVYPALFTLQIESLARQLAVGGAVVMVVGALIAFRPLATAFEWPLRKLDARWPLPLPPQPSVRFFLFAALPLFAWLYPFVRIQGVFLGKLSDAIVLALLLIAGIQIALAMPRRRWLSLVTPIVAVLALAVGVSTHTRFATPAFAAEKGLFAGLGAKWLRGASDFDRDGASSLLGGGDCAPFDRQRGPGRSEIYGNGIDEDCSGADDAPPAAESVGRRELFSGVVPEQLRKKYNIVWIVIDSARADHLSLYGYPKPTTPNIDELAKESLVFTRALSQSSATAFSFPSMFSGRNPAEITWWKDVNDAQRKNKEEIPQIARSETMLAERLKPLGYETAGILDSYTILGTIHLRQGLDTAFDATKPSTKRNAFNRRSALIAARAVNWIADHAVAERNKPIFLIAYYPDPHVAHIRHRDLHNDRHFNGPRAGYEAELAFVDQHIRVLLEALKARPFLWRDTIVVITGDHGDEFREHGGVSHATKCYIESLHVPLIVRIPGIEPKRIDTPVGLIDIIPTILEMVGATDDTDRLSGQSLLMPALRPEGVWQNRPLFCSVASQKAAQGDFFRRAVRQNGFALLQEVHDGRFELYDMTRDPREQRNLIDAPEHASRVEALKALLRQSYTGNLTDWTRLTKNTPE